MHSFFTMWLVILARHIYMNQSPDFIVFVVHEHISSNKSYYVFCVHNASISTPLAMDYSMKNNRTCVTKILRHSRSWLFQMRGFRHHQNTIIPFERFQDLWGDISHAHTKWWKILLKDLHLWSMLPAMCWVEIYASSIWRTGSWQVLLHRAQNIRLGKQPRKT